MELDILKQDAAPSTEVGSYFVSNYPPYSAWLPAHVSAVEQTLSTRPGAGPTDSDRAGKTPPPIGLYMHIPFCRKRCKFCYFRVYTDKNGADVERYLAGLTREIALYRNHERFANRQFDFVYFGGGTPSFLSDKQLLGLVERINQHWRWDAAREVTLECEPGTLKRHKLEAIKSIGVTRISLGVEHFDDEILEANGRAHQSPEIFRAYDWVREIGFQQVNCDLIAGMVGETDSKWRAAVEKMIDLSPDSVTIYQMELPHNTRISREIKDGGQSPIASWSQKRAWVDYAFSEFEKAGYVVSSAYTMVKPGPHSAFVYRDALWHGADMVGTGVASISHVGGTHYQNLDGWDDYL
ncbi:MAG: radical SAM protein, partial [Phycisphaerales bacterium]|nr:radical SAM protein [Phycisphaerales bacterium]